MPRVATFCPRCGESIDTQVPEEAKAAGRAELVCPSCKFRFVIAPAQGAPSSSPAPGSPPAQSPEEAAAQEGVEGSTSADPGGTPPPSSGPVQPSGPGGPSIPQATGAQVHRSPSGALPARLLSAGILLVFAAALGFFIGFLFVFGDITDDAVAGPPGPATLEGVVMQRGSGMGDVQVQLLESVSGRPDQNTTIIETTTTDPGGAFRFDGVQAGPAWVKVEQPGYRTTFVELIAFAEDGATIGSPALVNVVTLQEGDPEPVEYASVVDMFDLVATVLGWGILFVSTLALAGAVLTFMRRGFGWAVVGAVGGIFSIGFLVGSVMALVALVILLFSRREFRPLFKKKDDHPEMQ